MKSLREDYIKQVYVGETPIHNDTIVICEYSTEWPTAYQREAKRIFDALGSKVLELEHGGSTSVPGLCAKPIIDIVLVVVDSSCEQEYVPYLENVGYILKVREPDWYNHRMFNSIDSHVNLHVFSKDCEEFNRMILFRNWLRKHDEDRELYAKTKRELASKKWKYVQDYADAKSSVVKKIMMKAMK